MYRSHYSEESPSYLIGVIIIAVIFFIIVSVCNSQHIYSKRDDANMVYIKEGYCYEADTKIIYKETIINGGRYSYDSTTYTPYINENGNYCKYENKRWVEFIKD